MEFETKLNTSNTLQELAIAAFQRELPNLLLTHPDEFVVYYGEERIGPCKQLEMLDTQCKEKNIPIHNRLYRVIEEDIALKDISF